MQVISRRHAPQAYLAVSDAICPCCQGKLVRERRRVVDRLSSLIRPVKRYRCENFACQWMGNLGKPATGRSGTGMAAGAQSEGDEDQRSSGVPAAFIVHMILVAVGAVFVIVYSTLEPAASFDESAQASGSTVQQ